MRVAAIINSEAGSVQGAGLDAESLSAMFRQAGYEPDVRFVPGEKAVAAAQEALAAGAEVVAAGGGDGTIRSIASVLVGGAVPLGVLPLGTLNHFARDLGIPGELQAAVDLLGSGSMRALDVGEVNGEIFVNNSVLGFYPPTVKVRDHVRRVRDRGKWIATAIALARVAPRMPTLHVRVTAEGRTIVRDTRFVFIGNNEYELNLFTYSARSRLESGFLHLYVAKAKSRIGLFGLALLGLVRDIKRMKGFDCLSVPDLTIETDRKSLPVYLDGEVVTLPTPLVYRTRERALRVVLPAEITSSS
jgi:diacylglycerol kinase family enzyme